MDNLKWLSYTWTRLTKTEQIMLWLLDNVTNHRYASAHTYLLIGSPSFDWQIIACADWQIMCRERCKKEFLFNVDMSSTMITIQARNLACADQRITWSRQASWFHLPQFQVEFQAPSGGKSWIAKKLFHMLKSHSSRGQLSWRVSYARSDMRGFYCISDIDLRRFDFTVLINTA